MIGEVISVKKVWLSKKEVREYLDVSDEWIKKYLYANINSYNVGKKIYFKISDIDKFMEKRRI